MRFQCLKHLVLYLVHSNYARWTKKLNALWCVGSWTWKHWQMVEGISTTFWETSRIVLIGLGTYSGPSDTLLTHRPTKVIFCPAKTADIFDKKTAHERYPISLWNWDFLWVFHKAAAWQVATYFWKKAPTPFLLQMPASEEWFFTSCCLLCPESVTDYLVPLCLYLAITAPNLDANIVFFLKSTSKALMVT